MTIYIYILNSVYLYLEEFFYEEIFDVYFDMCYVLLCTAYGLCGYLGGH